MIDQLRVHENFDILETLYVTVVPGRSVDLIEFTGMLERGLPPR